MLLLKEVPSTPMNLATQTKYTYDADGERSAASVSGAGTMSATYKGAGTVSTNAAVDMTAATYDGNGVRASATTTPSGGSSST